MSTTTTTNVADEFRAMIAKRKARLAVLLAAAIARRGLRARHATDAGYAILLTPDMSRGTGWRVTSFRNGEPLGHREYDVLDGGGPTRDALAEFMGEAWEIHPAV